MRLGVRVAGSLPGTPALPAGGDFVVVPMSAVRGIAGLGVNVMLLAGPATDTSALYRVVDANAQAASVTVRSAVLSGLAGAPLQRSTFAMLTLAAVAAALLGLVAMLAQLALGAADRELTLARLAAMGLGTGQRTRLVLLEVLPAVFATAVAAVGSILALPSAVGPAIDLSVFTQSGMSVPIVPDIAALVLPLLGLMAVAAIALTVEIQAGPGRRGVTASMRAPSAGYETLAGRGESR
jgi:putative ABC transport system permease protein